MENVISGKLEYLKMVKGINNSTYTSLNKRFTKLLEDFWLNQGNDISEILDLLENQGIEEAMKKYYSNEK